MTISNSTQKFTKSNTFWNVKREDTFIWGTCVYVTENSSALNDFFVFIELQLNSQMHNMKREA